MAPTGHHRLRRVAIAVLLLAPAAGLLGPLVAYALTDRHRR
ncbi:hypothetical protein ABT052_19260 [Streptomyces sp. NPDC002766]